MTDDVVVVHHSPEWLAQTKTWLYTQVKYLPSPNARHVVCDTVANLDQFPVEHLHCLQRDDPTRYRRDVMLRRFKVFGRGSWVSSVCKRVHADILHSHFGTIGFHDLGAARAAHTRHIVTFYGVDVNSVPSGSAVWRRRYIKMFRNVDRVLCEGSHMARRIVELGCPEDKVLVHHLGVELNHLPFRPRTWLPGMPLRVLLAGTFVEKKGHPVALQALAELARDLPIEVTLIGDATIQQRSQEERHRILKAVADGGPALKVRLLGFQPHATMLEEAYQHHLFLAPSQTAVDGDTEGGAPVSIIEMAASGMPVVATSHCDIPEVVQDGVTGLLAPEKDVEGLVAHLRTLVNRPSTWNEMTMMARKHIESEYDAVRQGERLGKIYHSLMVSAKGLS